MTRTERSFIITIYGDPNGHIQNIDPTEVKRALTQSGSTVVIPTQDVDVVEVKGNISVQSSGQVKPKPKRKVNAENGLDLHVALAIASAEPMSAGQRRHRDGLIVASLDAGVTADIIARHTGLSVQSIHLIRRNAT